MWPQSPKYFTAWPSTESLPTLALNPRAITEKPQQATADKATKLMIKWNYKKISIYPKEGRKEEKQRTEGERNRWQGRQQPPQNHTKREWHLHTLLKRQRIR